MPRGVYAQNCAWPPADCDLLRKLWGEGLSASEIAKQIGGVTRNAVIGKKWRLGLPPRQTTTSARQGKPWTPARREASERSRPDFRSFNRSNLPARPRKLGIPVTDPCVLAATAWLEQARAAERRNEGFRAR